MQMDDMILVSIDDHMIEPPDMYENHVPGQVAGPGAEGRPQRRRASTSGCSRGRRPRRRSAWPPPSAGRGGVGLQPRLATPSCGPGCFDVHERVRDMNANGVLASMNFPTMAGFNARTFTEARRQGARARHAPGLQRLGHRRVVRRLPRPVHPARHRPDVGRRPRGRGGAPHRQEGLPVDQLPRDPARAGLPELPVGPLGPDAAGAVRREHGPVAAHRRRLRGHPARRRRRRSTTSWCWPARSAPSPRRTCCSARRCASSPTSRSRCPRAASAGSPSTSTGSTATSRTRRGCTTATTSAASCRPRCSASTSSPATSPTRPGLLLRDRIGIDIIAWECDYPHTDTTWPESPEFAWKEFQDAGCTDEEIHKITWENACRFFDWDPFAHTAEGRRRRSARSGPWPTDVDTTRMPRAEWRKQNEAAGIGVF